MKSVFPKGSLFYLLAWAFLVTILVIPEVNNHTETEDAYVYAKELVEEDKWSALVHNNHKIFHIICDEIYELVKKIGGLDALSVMIQISTVCSVLTLLVWNQIFLLLGVQKWRALLIIALLSVTYNFWRYTHAAEINAMAWLTQALCFYLLLRVSSIHLKIVSLSFMGCLAALVHTVSIIPVTAVVCAYFLFTKKVRHSVCFIITFGCIVFASFSFLDHYRVKGEPKTTELLVLDSFEKGKILGSPKSVNPDKRRLTLKSFPKAAVGLGACAIGTNIVMGYDSVYKILSESLFKDRYLLEERYMAEGVSIPHKVIWIISSSALVLLIIRICLVGVGQMRGYKQIGNLIAKCFEEPFFPALWVGCMVSAVFIFWFEPGNPEMWALLLPVLFLPIYVIWSFVSLRKVALLYPLLLLVNYVGGISLLEDTKRDYFHATLVPLLSDARDGDVLMKSVVHSGIPRYVNYYYPSILVETIIVDSQLNKRYEKIIQYLSEGKRIFLHQEVLMREEGFGINLHSINLGFIPHYSGGGEIIALP